MFNFYKKAMPDSDYIICNYPFTVAVSPSLNEVVAFYFVTAFISGILNN